MVNTNLLLTVVQLMVILITVYTLWEPSREPSTLASSQNKRIGFIILGMLIIIQKNSEILNQINNILEQEEVKIPLIEKLKKYNEVLSFKYYVLLILAMAMVYILVKFFSIK